MNNQIEFNWPVRVYYEDTDAGGVVFYANYLRYLEREKPDKPANTLHPRHFHQF